MSLTVKAPTVRPAPGTEEVLTVLEELSRAVGCLKRDDPDGAAACVAKAREAVATARAKVADVPERASDVHVVLRIEGDLFDTTPERVAEVAKHAIARVPRLSPR